MPRPLSACMNDIVHGDEVKKQQKFVKDTEEFPCLFNLGSCKLDIGSQKYTGQNVCELDVPKNMWKSVLEDLNNESEVSECDNEVWKYNLQTYVYAELGEYGEAFKLNKKIKDQHGMKNLVALVNAAFLFFRTGSLNEAYAMLNDFKMLKTQQKFADLKIDAICELGYAFRKLGGANNLQFSISFLEFVLLFRPCDEQIQLMLAIVYRRCTHFHIYSADPENINRHDFAMKAATSLFKLGTTSKNTSFRAAALIELAYLKYHEHGGNKKTSILSTEEWFQIVQQRTWKQLCEEALEISDEGPSEKVLKIAGQLYRYYGTDDEFLQKSEQLLKTAIAKRPSNRAHHHLGLTYKKMAVRHEQKNNVNETHMENIQGAVGGYNVKPGSQYKLNGFGNNTAEMKLPNSGNYRQRFVSRQEHTIRRGAFNNNERGGFSSNGVKRKPQVFFNSNTEMNHTSRGYHQQGFNSRYGRNIHQGNFQQPIKSSTGRYSRDDGYNERNEFGNNSVQMKHINRGNHQQRVADRQQYNTHQQGFENSAAVAVDGYARSSYPIKPEKFVNNVEMKHASRRYHQQGFTYRHEQVPHQENYQQPIQYTADRNARDVGYNHSNEFGNNASQMKCVNQENYRQSFADRQDYHMHRQGFENSMGGATHGYAGSGFSIKPKEFVHNMEKRRTNWGFHDQGFNNRLEHNTHHQILENNTQGTGGCRLKVLPEPPLNSSPQQLEKNLKYVAKVPDQFKSFSNDNPYTDKAIDYLKQAVKLSRCQNKVAMYDLACILVQAEDYEKSKETCKDLIKGCTSLKTLTTHPIYLVNAYNLYGICCAKEAEAEVNQVNKRQLLAESEEHLTVAVRLASCLAASVPELEMCATDLWNAFRSLQKKFKFQGQKESRDKLFMLCEYISDYRFLEAVDDIVSQDPSELQKLEVIEQCLQRYLNMKAYNSALLFRDLVSLQPGVKPKLSNSTVYRQLVLEVAEGKLDETYQERNTRAGHPDHVWKQLFADEFCVTENSKKYDIVIMSDVDDDYELKKGMMSDISEYLKLVLLETFGLNVVRAHEESYPGGMYLEQQLKVISSSHVSLFVLTASYTDSLSLASEVASLRISENGHTVPESTAVNNESRDGCTPEGAMAGNQNENENSVSRMYERIINASISNVLSKMGATRMMLVVPCSLKLEDLPQAVRGLPTVVLTQSEIETLTATAPGRSNEQNINLMKKIFRAVIGKFQA